MPHGFSPLATPMTAEAPPQAIRRAVTGNRLRDGVPVYFTAAGAWSPNIDHAASVAEAAAEALLRDAESRSAGGSPDAVLAPYLIEVIAAAACLEPVSLRERIRAFGPTVRSGAL